jgi:hypothetical protein
LLLDPVKVRARERVGLLFRSSARDRDPHATIGVDANDVSPCAEMTHEIELRQIGIP